MVFVKDFSYIDSQKNPKQNKTKQHNYIGSQLNINKSFYLWKPNYAKDFSLSWQQ